MPLVQLLSSNASGPVNARWQTFGDIIDVDISAVGRWLLRCAQCSECAACTNCAAKFTPTKRCLTWSEGCPVSTTCVAPQHPRPSISHKSSRFCNLSRFFILHDKPNKP